MLNVKAVVSFAIILLFVNFLPLSSNKKIVEAGSNIPWSRLVGCTVADINNMNLYKRFARGQCTWYAWGRFMEVHNKAIMFSKPLQLHAKFWGELITNCVIDGNVSEKCIAINESGRYGHLIFIEHIDTENIYYTESNDDRNGYYDKGKDCILKKAPKNSDVLKSFTLFIHP